MSRSALALLFAMAACDRAAIEPPRSAREPVYVDVTLDSGLQFVHANGARGDFHPPEIMGGGAGFADLDGDGRLDAVLVQGGPVLDTRVGPAATLFFAVAAAPLRFEAVALAGDGHGQGIAIGDYDNDGRVDLYLTGFRRNRLLRNLGGGRFDDVTDAAGAGDDRWSVPAVFFDYDGDGWLDLWIGNYLDYAPAAARTCRGVTGAIDYCAPGVYRGVADRLLRNRGDGTFVDVTAASGIGAVARPALGVVAADLDGDGLVDLYVANDGARNQQWMNRGDGTFVDEALLRGTALNAEGMAEAGMGIDADDPDGDGDLDLFVTHLIGETNTLYENEGGATFRDATVAAGLASPSRTMTGFGTRFLDFDLDGHLDIVVGNGSVGILADLGADPFPYHQPNQLFRNRGDGTFVDVSADAGPAFAHSGVTRGVAVGDVDDDGDDDLLIADNGGAARLLLSQAAVGDDWLGLRLVDRSGRSPQGALIVVERVGGASLTRRAGSDGSYVAAHDPRVLFGLGGSEVAGVRVDWPDGMRERFPAPPRGRYTTLTQGGGT